MFNNLCLYQLSKKESTETPQSPAIDFTYDTINHEFYTTLTPVHLIDKTKDTSKKLIFIKQKTIH